MKKSIAILLVVLFIIIGLCACKNEISDKPLIGPISSTTNNQQVDSTNFGVSGQYLVDFVKTDRKDNSKIQFVFKKEKQERLDNYRWFLS